MKRRGSKRCAADFLGALLADLCHDSLPSRRLLRGVNVYILERSGHALRVVDSQGKIRTVAGTGKKGPARDNVAALEATFNGPKHLCIDRAAWQPWPTSGPNWCPPRRRAASPL